MYSTPIFNEECLSLTFLSSASIARYSLCRSSSKVFSSWRRSSSNEPFRNSSRLSSFSMCGFFYVPHKSRYSSVLNVPVSLSWSSSAILRLILANSS